MSRRQSARSLTMKVRNVTDAAQTERAALCDLFDAVGPDAPTLCEGWTTRDLAAHLIVRERRPDAALGILAKPFEKHGESVRLATAAKPWPWLISTVRSGPPRFSPTAIPPVDELVNTLEFFVHHEDVLRLQPEIPPRVLDESLASSVWKQLGRAGKMLVRSQPYAITLDAPGREPLSLKSGDQQVTIRGEVGDLVMFVEGRQRATEVVIDGPDGADAALRGATFGI